jgi:energy-converting hydrogenase Eha subunit C
MTYTAENDSAIDLAASIELLTHHHHATLDTIAQYIRRTLLVQGGLVILCAAAAWGALAIANHRPEPMASIMMGCAVLNLMTAALCVRLAFRAVREARQDAAQVRALLRELEAAMAVYAVLRALPEGPLPLVLTRTD